MWPQHGLLEPWGSSPLARGKWTGPHTPQDPKGFIPTRAGKIIFRSQSQAFLAVHPHSRGENTDRTTVTGIAAGSSPLARGKCAAVAWLEDSVGFIPTRAGKMRCINSQRCRVKVHPHSRGENRIAAGTALVGSGSSPLARGKLHLMVLGWCIVRFIPTRAGKIASLPSQPTTPGVHPHSRGENRAN